MQVYWHIQFMYLIRSCIIFDLQCNLFQALPTSNLAIWPLRMTHLTSQNPNGPNPCSFIPRFTSNFLVGQAHGWQGSQQRIEIDSQNCFNFRPFEVEAFQLSGVQENYGSLVVEKNTQKKNRCYATVKMKIRSYW